MICRHETGSQLQTSCSQHIFIAYFANICHVSGNTSGINSFTRSNVSAAVACKSERSIVRQHEVPLEDMHFTEVVSWSEIRC
jgi:hypothetical protein